jgi:hypothetical protein
MSAVLSHSMTKQLLQLLTDNICPLQKDCRVFLWWTSPESGWYQIPSLYGQVLHQVHTGSELIKKEEVLGRTNRYFPSYDMDCIENDTFSNSSTVACIFIAVVMFTPSCYLATMGIFIYSCCLVTIGEYRYRHTDWWERLKKTAVETSSGSMMYIPSFIKIAQH